MLRARVTNSTKFAKAKIFMMVADKWMLFNYNIKMYLTNKKITHTLIKFYKIFFHLSQNMFVYLPVKQLL